MTAALMAIYAWVANPANIATATTVGWFVSEILAQIPSIKANSVFQLVFGWLKSKQPPTV